MHSCSYSGQVNNFDQAYTYNVPSGQVLRGKVSQHSNTHEWVILDLKFYMYFVSVLFIIALIYSVTLSANVIKSSNKS